MTVSPFLTCQKREARREVIGPIMCCGIFVWPDFFSGIVAGMFIFMVLHKWLARNKK